MHFRTVTYDFLGPTGNSTAIWKRKLPLQTCHLRIGWFMLNQSIELFQCDFWRLTFVDCCWSSDLSFIWQFTNCKLEPSVPRFNNSNLITVGCAVYKIALQYREATLTVWLEVTRQWSTSYLKNMYLNG